MNISGSDVSKEAANMILLGTYSLRYAFTRVLIGVRTIDDNFASTVSECMRVHFHTMTLNVVMQRALLRVVRSS